jgi:hypothetical protein
MSRGKKKKEDYYFVLLFYYFCEWACCYLLPFFFFGRHLGVFRSRWKIAIFWGMTGFSPNDYFQP